MTNPYERLREPSSEWREQADTFLSFLVYSSFLALTCPKDWLVERQRFLLNFEKYRRSRATYSRTGSPYSRTLVHR